MEISVKTINIIASVLLGLLFASLFDGVCKDGNCVIVEAKPLDEVENAIYKKDSKCYRYRAKATKCITSGAS